MTITPYRKITRSEREALEAAYKIAGSKRRLALKLDMTPQALSKWAQRGVPVERVPALSKLTGIPRWRFRPDIFKRQKEAA